jgi:predicted nucleic acid-binding protein
LNAVGTLNVLEFAAVRKLLELKPTLEALRRTTFYITDDYIDAALQRDAERQRQ